MLGHDEIVGEAVRQGLAVQVHDALVALANGRIDGNGQYAVGQQVGQRGIRGNAGRIKTGQATDFSIAGAFDHQQRHRAFGTGLQAQQAIDFLVAHQQRSRSHQLAQQLLDRLWISVLGQHVSVAVLQRGQFAAGVAGIEHKALCGIGFV